jgi:hypothetical protein
MFSKKVRDEAEKYGKKNGFKVSQNENTIDLEKGDEMIELEQGAKEGRVNHYGKRFGKKQWYMEDGEIN